MKKADEKYFNSKKVVSKKKSNLFAVKDNFWTKDFFTTASSNFLSDFKSGSDCTVVSILKKNGYELLGKAILDEFACGGTGLNSNRDVRNPFDREKIAGGSSSGSAILVAKKIVRFSLATDTGDSIRRPAAYCRVFGFKPSYGSISRYGIIPMSSSLDTVGIISYDLKIIKKIFSLISTVDNKDIMTFRYNRQCKNENSNGIIYIINGIEKNLPKEIRVEYLSFLKILKSKYKVLKIIIPKEIRDNIQFSYKVITSTELLSHLNSLQGITFAKSKDIKEKSDLLGKEVKKRLILGSYFLRKPEIIKRSKEILYITNEWFKKIFKEGSFLIFPSFGKIPEIKKSKDIYEIKKDWTERLFLLSNFTGSPSITIPFKGEKCYFSITLNSFFGNDDNLISLSKKIKDLKE